ncbi:DUF4268 domain-containing protein [Defluviimonas aestuarii]|uniref:DUF4268 domain-containing protein n=1 Tax=Albidovulum aestuarii TaxID=1130726 RepID=UPI00249C2761|nr:DUF4268 domain-containing protein [Defluviimonas aestuarii]MDI3338201.1 DUF4268 domain-containing protein [Defluviimonas aestuarii]
MSIDLELEAQERSVGPFRADILCKDTANGNWVLVENQLERTDHTHLGQLITYAAGLQAVTIVWVASRFAEEHRAACDWLNEVTDEKIRVFGLEVELWRIGASPAAPKFNVVCKPNNWSKSVASAKRGLEGGSAGSILEMQRNYWTAFEELLASSSTPINPVSPPAQSWVAHGIGRTGVGLNLAMNTKENYARVEIYFSGSHAKSNYAQIEQRKAEVEASLGEPLHWQPLPQKKDCRISLALTNIDLTDEDDWPRQHQWLVEKMTSFYHVFRPLVLSLKRDIAAPVGNDESRT